MAPDPSSPQLSISRINRLMRPLRNRCNALAAFHAETRRSGRCAPVTYSSQAGSSSSVREADVPPLANLPPPGRSHAQMYLLKNGTAKLELSRRVYAVRDSFRDIVVKTQPQMRPSTQLGPRIPPMAALCSIVVGASMQPPEVDEENGNDDMQDMNHVNTIYESVPIEHRRWAVLSHCLTIILEANVRDSTLFALLLDITLSHGLQNESVGFLRELLLIAVEPQEAFRLPPKLAHAAHAPFLVDLRSQWLKSGLSDGTFVCVFLEIMTSSCNSELWTCKAVTTFARNIRGSNFPMFIQILASCMDIFGTIRSPVPCSGRKNRSKLQGVRSSEFGQLHQQLYKWIQAASDHYLFSNDASPSMAEASDTVLKLLKSGLTSDFYQKARHEDKSGPSCDLQGAITSLATNWLSDPLSSHCPAGLEIVVHQLSMIIPQGKTYDVLVQGQFSKLELNSRNAVLENCAYTLRSCHLISLEASLWACALRHAELPDYERSLILVDGIDKVGQYRQRLITMVEDAEQRCFGQVPVIMKPNSNTRSDRMPASSNKHVNTRWKFEPSLCVWTSAATPQPASKKMKFESHRKLRSISLPNYSLKTFRGTRSKSTKRSQRTTVIRDPSHKENSGNKSHPRLSPLRGNTERYTGGGLACVSTSKYVSGPPPKAKQLSFSYACDNEEVLCQFGDNDGQLRFRRRSSNFASLVADAHSNRTVLHASKTSVDYGFSHSPSASPAASHQLTSNTITSENNFLASDDALDLFTYGLSSPSICSKYGAVD